MFDYIKIDGSLIKDILINTSSQNIVSMLVNFAKGQKVKTIFQEIWLHLYRTGSSF
jgi:EAL domain-containing protein (putative c-di-GMP-specific phosphodiesterase class I)